MESRVRCEVVRDLLPTYIEGLTSEVTNEEIESHLSSCKECEMIYNEMITPIEDPLEMKEMDYLKKVKQRTDKKIITGVALIVGFFLLLMGIRMYVVGGNVNSIANYYTSMSTTKEGKDVLILQGELANREKVFKKHTVTIEDGTATIKLIERAALPWEDNNNYYVGYEIPSGVNRIILNEHIIWEDGVVIGRETNKIYETKHAYVGDASANGRTAGALQIGKFGSFLNSLQTTEEPYGWTMKFTESITNDTIFNERMTQYAYVILSLIDNLGEVSWEYKNGSKVITKTVTTKEATKALGQDIKEYSKSISEFQTLLNQLYL